MSYDTLMSQARKTNAQRDSDDRGLGFPAPGDCDVLVHVRTAMSAIQAGISVSSWECVAEGQVMLEEIEERLKRGNV